MTLYSDILKKKQEHEQVIWDLILLGTKGFLPNILGLFQALYVIIKIHGLGKFLNLTD